MSQRSPCWDTAFWHGPCPTVDAVIGRRSLLLLDQRTPARALLRHA
ncbi:hypothetical protein [Actinoplanes sp. NPDC026619]